MLFIIDGIACRQTAGIVFIRLFFC